MGDFLESAEIPCVAEIQTMGTVMVPSRVNLERIIIEPRDHPHLGDFRLIITVDGNLVYSDETPRGRFTVDIEDRASGSSPRQIIAVVIPMSVPVPIRSYLTHETVQITVVGTHEDVDDRSAVTSSTAIELATVELDYLTGDYPDDFIDRWS
jgi:hypothetical protein